MFGFGLSALGALCNIVRNVNHYRHAKFELKLHSIGGWDRLKWFGYGEFVITLFQRLNIAFFQRLRHLPL